MDNYEATSQKDWDIIKNGSFGLEESGKEDQDNGDFVDLYRDGPLFIGKLCSEC